MNHSIGKRIKILRLENNLTQEELAKKINTLRSNIANYENNKNNPSIVVLEKLSKIFNCSTDYLLGITNNPTLVRDFANLPNVSTDYLRKESNIHDPINNLEMSDKKIDSTKTTSQEQNHVKETLDLLLELIEVVKQNNTQEILQLLLELINKFKD